MFDQHDHLLRQAVKVQRNVVPCGNSFHPKDAMLHVGIPWSNATSIEFLHRFEKMKQAVDAVLGRATFRGHEGDVVNRAMNLSKLHRSPLKLRAQDTEHILFLAGSTLPHVHNCFIVELQELQAQLGLEVVAGKTKQHLAQRNPKRKIEAFSFELAAEDICRMSKKTRVIRLLVRKAVETYRNIPDGTYTGFHAMIHVGIQDPLYLQNHFQQDLEKVEEEKGPATFSNNENELLLRSLSLLLLSHCGVLGKQNCAALIRLAGGTTEHTKSGRFRQKFYREHKKLREYLQVSAPSALPPPAIECNWGTENTEMVDNISPLTVTEDELIASSFYQKDELGEQELQLCRTEKLVLPVSEREGQLRSDIVTVEGSIGGREQTCSGVAQLEAKDVSSAGMSKPVAASTPVGKAAFKGTPVTVAVMSDEDTCHRRSFF